MADHEGKDPDTEDRKLKQLANYIIFGSKKIEDALDLLDFIEKDSLMKYRKNDETLLHLTAKFHDNAILVEKLISLCPELLTSTRSGKYEGQTALHMAICKENLEAVEVMVSNPEKCDLLTIPATGSRFPHTVMMGELPLSVAAITFNDDIVLQLIDAGAPISAQNSSGDTVFHSLVKYSDQQAGNEEDVIRMMKILNNRLAKGSCDDTVNIHTLEERHRVAVWLLANDEHLTPFLLAAKLGQVEIFNFILNLEGVYCRLDEHDGLFDINLYDITEIDGVAMQKVAEIKTRSTSKIVPYNTIFRRNQMAASQNFQSVLERISKINIYKAFAFLLLPVIKNIIKDKWSCYQWYYYAWAILHSTHISLLMWYAFERTKLTNIRTSQNISEDVNIPQTSKPSQYTERFVEVFTYINILVSVLYLLLEFRRLAIQKQEVLLSKIHHNGTYRLLLIFFAMATITDSVWFILQPGYNYFLIVSILIGSWFLTFFLRAFKKFSFFTVMIQKIIFSDLFRFSIIIVFELLCFTAVIYLQFVTSDPVVPEFQNYETSLLTLLNIMLGLSNITVFHQAHDPMLAVGLFVIFTLLTYVLMINALIAMMSETCKVMSSNKRTQWQLQRLSIILFIEQTLCLSMRKCCGEKKFVKHYDLKQNTMTQEERYFLEMDSLQMSFSKGEMILARRNFAQTSRFDDVNSLQSHQYQVNQRTLYTDNYGKLQKQNWSQRLQHTGTEYDVADPQNDSVLHTCSPLHHARQNRYKKYKHGKMYTQLSESQQSANSSVYTDSDTTKSGHRKSVYDQMLTKPTHMKQLPQSTDLINDALVSSVSKEESTEAIKEVKLLLTIRTESDEVVVREKLPITNIKNQVESQSASKDKSKKHIQRKKSKSSVHMVDIIDGDQTRHTDLYDKHKCYKHQELRQATTADGLHQQEKNYILVEEPQIDISTVYISS